jgi:hypothetical protein
MIQFVCCFFFGYCQALFSVARFVETFHVYVRIMLSSFASLNERWELRSAREWFLSFPLKCLVPFWHGVLVCAEERLGDQRNG